MFSTQLYGKLTKTLLTKNVRIEWISNEEVNKVSVVMVES